MPSWTRSCELRGMRERRQGWIHIYSPGDTLSPANGLFYRSVGRGVCVCVWGGGRVISDKGGYIFIARATHSLLLRVCSTGGWGGGWVCVCGGGGGIVAGS